MKELVLKKVLREKIAQLGEEWVPMGQVATGRRMNPQEVAEDILLTLRTLPNYVEESGCPNEEALADYIMENDFGYELYRSALDREVGEAIEEEFAKYRNYDF